MATAPQATLPLFYNDLMPLNSRDHGGWRSRTTDKAKWLVNQHAIPLTVEEFPQAQRNYPIVFSSGDGPVPLALMGLNEGVNVFVDEDGAVTEAVYVPAYARRYPFMLAKLNPEADDLSLCFDPTTDLIGAFDEGAELFDGESPTDACKATLNFCEQFEIAGQKTQAFIDELQKNKLLMDGEVAIQQEGKEQPFIYRGFQMVDESKLRELRGDKLREWNQNGMLGLIFAHLFSLELMSNIFSRQLELGKGPVVLPAA
ncbi:MAG: SapC family protein [Novosphingobium sp.]